MIYLDSSYLVRLYFEDRGFEAVRELAATDTLACGQHGRAEIIAALHRKMRERSVTKSLYLVARQQFLDEIRAGAFRWLPLSEAIFERIEFVFASLPAMTFLRAAAAMHLSAAAENRFREIYSNDANLLAAASHFGLRGVDVIE
jgi:predicted nucleic acid-binding protein